MKILQNPNPEVIIQASESDLNEAWMKQGLKIPFKTKNGEIGYWWRVEGCWIMILSEKHMHAKDSTKQNNEQSWKSEPASNKQKSFMI